MKKLLFFLVALPIFGFGACSQSATGPSMSRVVASAAGMTITINTTQAITISSLVVSLNEGGFVNGLDRINEHGHTTAPLVAAGKFDLAAVQINVPEGTSTIRLYAVLGSGDVRFTTNPARDWVVRDTSGRVLELPDEDLRLQLSTKVHLLVNGEDRPIISVPLGTCVTLSWTSQDATVCQAYFDWPSGVGSEKPLAGSEVVCPTERSDYVLRCYGPEGSVGDGVTVVFPR